MLAVLGCQNAWAAALESLAPAPHPSVAPATHPHHQEGRGRTEMHLLSSISQASIMSSIKQMLEILAEISAATAAILWFLSARVRLTRRGAAKQGLASGVDDPKALLSALLYEFIRCKPGSER